MGTNFYFYNVPKIEDKHKHAVMFDNVVPHSRLIRMVLNFTFKIFTRIDIYSNSSETKFMFIVLLSFSYNNLEIDPQLETVYQFLHDTQYMRISIMGMKQMILFQDIYRGRIYPVPIQQYLKTSHHKGVNVIPTNKFYTT